MPNKQEHSDKIIRYREHRRLLTRFASHELLSPRLAMFAELVLLWLDARPGQEDHLWECLSFMMHPPLVRGGKTTGGRSHISPSDDEDLTAPDKEAAAKLTGLISGFLAEETYEDQPAGS